MVENRDISTRELLIKKERKTNIRWHWSAVIPYEP